MEKFLRPAADRFLVALKMRGPQTAAELGCATGVCGEAARQQLVRLASEGLVAATTHPRGVGRPAQLWTLTPAGNARFPDTGAELSATLIRLIRQKLGDDALQQLVDALAAEARRNYRSALKGASTLEEKVARLAEARSREGYMAEWLHDGEGGFLLLENHCPIASATTTACGAFCRAEIETFRTVLGRNVAVEPTEHIVQGDRRSAYHIRPAKPRISRAPTGRRAPRRRRSEP